MASSTTKLYVIAIDVVEFQRLKGFPKNLSCMTFAFFVRSIDRDEKENTFLTGVLV